MLRRVFLVFILVCLAVWAAAQPARAAHLGQSAELVTITVEPVTYEFGQLVVFRGALETSLPVYEVDLVFQEQGQTSSHLVSLPLDSTGQLYYAHPIAERSIRAFAVVDYWFLVTLEEGQIVKSDMFSFEYLDNRFTWSTLEQAPFRVHWYDGSTAFGQFVLDKARQGLEKFEERVGVGEVDWIDIYVYGDFMEYQYTRGFLGPLWAGGHANPAHSLIVVSLPPLPDQYVQAERKIPHEVAHILLYAVMGDGYIYLPTWFSEGLATQNELFPNTDYDRILQNAYTSGEIIPFAQLCEGFPREAGVALTAYAQSSAFVDFLFEQYGSAGIRAMLANYASGASCALGTRVEPVDQPLTQLERAWRSEAFGERYTAVIVQGLAPWVGLVLVIFSIPIILMAYTRQSSPGDDPLVWVSRK